VKNSEITAVKARELLDSKGRPMVEVDVLTSSGAFGRGSAPCGTSIGKYEAFVLRDGGKRFDGLGVKKAVRNVTDIIAPILLGGNIFDQRAIDERMIELDGTPNKSQLGANAIYSVSVAVARAAANDKGLPLYRYLSGDDLRHLPVPAFNVINGGPYSDTSIEFQEFLLLPTSANTYAEALRMGVEVFYEIGRTIEKRYGRNCVRSGHYGGYAAPVDDPFQIIQCLLDAVHDAGYGGKFQIGLDCAASHFYDEKRKIYRLRKKQITRADMITFLESLTKSFPIFFIEDPLEEDDFDGFAEITARLGALIVGDDLFATNIERLRQGIVNGAADAILFKPNQIGTLTEAIDTAKFATAHGYYVIPSSRGGGTVDDPITDISAAIPAPFAKFGAPRTGERTNYQNCMLRMEEEMGESVHLFDLGKIEKKNKATSNANN
jgi:enolase